MINWRKNDKESPLAIFVVKGNKLSRKLEQSLSRLHWGLKVAGQQIVSGFSIYCKSIWSPYFPADPRWILTQFFFSGFNLFSSTLSALVLSIHFKGPFSVTVSVNTQYVVRVALINHASVPVSSLWRIQAELVCMEVISQCTTDHPRAITNLVKKEDFETVKSIFIK